MTNYVKTLIEHNIELLTNNDFDTLYGLCSSEYRHDLTDVLETAQVNYKEHLTEVPSLFAYRYTFAEQLLQFNNATCIKRLAFKSAEVEQVIANSCVKIEKGAFSFSRNTKRIEVNNVEYIDSDGFIGCNELTDVKLGNRLQYLGSFAFGLCSSLTYVRLPVTLEQIGHSAFNKCYSLDQIHYDGTMQQWNSVNKHSRWAYGSHIKQVICSDGIVAVDAYDRGER